MSFFGRGGRGGGAGGGVKSLQLRGCNDPGLDGKQILLLWRNTLSSHRNVSIFTQRMHNLTKRQFL